ncbi:hypothetical protein OKW35_003593 [Paraburkholderia sp. MM5477-R1]
MSEATTCLTRAESTERSLLWSADREVALLPRDNSSRGFRQTLRVDSDDIDKCKVWPFSFDVPFEYRLPVTNGPLRSTVRHFRLVGVLIPRGHRIPLLVFREMQLQRRATLPTKDMELPEY